MKIAWATDIRLTEVGQNGARTFCERVRQSQAEALLLGGDTAEAWDLKKWLLFLEQNLHMPIHFVLGNHDYYGGNISGTRDQMRAIESPNLNWLPHRGIVKLTAETALIGHGGWADARNGHPLERQVVLNDVLLIRDLRQVVTSVGGGGSLGDWLNRPALEEKLRDLGDDAASTMTRHLAEALDAFPHIIVLTHVPPFSESDLEASPEIQWAARPTCTAVGDLLLRVVAEHPHRDVTLLSSSGVSLPPSRPLPNLHFLKRPADDTGPGFEILPIE